MATSKYVKYFQTSSRAPLSGARIWIVPQSSVYPTSALELTAHLLRPGVYLREACPDGEYKVYIDPAGGASPTLYEEHIWIGENKISLMAAFANESGQISTAGIQNSAVTEEKLAAGSVVGATIQDRSVSTSKIAVQSVTETELGSQAVSNSKIKDGTITEAKLAQSLLDLINAAGGGSITNHPDGVTITESADHLLSVVPFFDHIGVKTSSPLASLHVGRGTVNNSSDAQILLSNIVDDSVAGSGHGYSESSQITRSGGISYASFDARVNYNGSNNYGHHAAFQAAPTFGTIGTHDIYYGFVSVPTMSAGVVTNSYGFYASDPAGVGSVVNNYGVYIPQLVRGSANNYAIYTVGNTKSYFGGNVGFGIQNTGTAKLFVKGSVGVGDALFNPGKMLEVQSSSGVESSFRIRQAGYNFWDLIIPASSSTFEIRDTSGAAIVLATGGKVYAPKYLSVGTTSRNLAPFQVGNGAVCNSVDAMALISRDVDDAGTGNAHGYSDSSNIVRSGNTAYNSYDARTTFGGTNDFNHYAGFQSGPTYGSSGTIGIIYGFVNSPVINAGTVTNNYAYYVTDPTGAGAVTNNYGLYIPQLSKGTTLNYAIYTAGNTKSYFGGAIGVGGANTGTAIAYFKGNVGIGDALFNPGKPFEIQMPNGTEASFRLRQAGQNYWDFKSIASTTRLDIADAGGTYLTILTGGKIGIKNISPATELDVTGSIQASVTIKTGAPSGGTAGAWKLGSAAVVSPTSPNRTIQIDIGGTTYYLAAKTTND